MRCEYCGQITEGVECRKCGAPMPDTDAADQWEEANIAGSIEYSRRNNINNAIQMAEGGMVSAKKILEHLGDPDPDETIQSFAAYNYWYQRSLVNWRMNGQTNEPGG